MARSLGKDGWTKGIDVRCVCRGCGILEGGVKNFAGWPLHRPCLGQKDVMVPDKASQGSTCMGHSHFAAAFAHGVVMQK